MKTELDKSVLFYVTFRYDLALFLRWPSARSDSSVERDSFRGKEAILKIKLPGKGLTQEINEDWWVPSASLYQQQHRLSHWSGQGETTERAPPFTMGGLGWLTVGWTTQMRQFNWRGTMITPTLLASLRNVGFIRMAKSSFGITWRWCGLITIIATSQEARYQRNSLQKLKCSPFEVGR